MRFLVFLFLVFYLSINTYCQKKYLFINDDNIAKTYGVNRTINNPVKHNLNPLIIADKEWEEGVNCFGSVIYDNNKFRMWYQIYNAKEKTDKRFAYTVGYAESSDGISWTKPNLDIFEYKGSRQNNLVLLSYGASDLYSPAVVKDLAEKDLAKRYKMFYWDCMSDENLKKHGNPFPKGVNVPGWTALDGEGFFVAFSPDGITWTKHGTQPVFTCACDASSLILDKDGSYKSYFKISNASDRHFRVLGYSESNDFLKWTTPKTILEPDWKDEHGTEFYGMSVTNYFNNYIGLIWMYYNSPSDKLMDIQFATSNNSIDWQRAGDRKVFLPVGKSGEWDAGAAIVASQMIVSPDIDKDKIYIYYGGSTTRHDDSRKYHRENTIGLATIRLDGFASMDAKLFKGFIETNPITPNNKNMYINAIANKGYIQIDVVNPKTGEVIAKSKEVKNIDKTKILITFENNWQLTTTQEYAFRFNMQKASLFSFWFE